MTKLKTLKDLKRWNGGLRFRNKDFIETSKLKAEAVKWIKEDSKDIIKLFDIGQMDERDLTIMDLTLKIFCNITEEDLNGKE